MVAPANALVKCAVAVGSGYRLDAVLPALSALPSADFFPVLPGLAASDDGGGAADARAIGGAAAAAAAATGDAVARAAVLLERLGGGLSPTAWSVTFGRDFLAMADM